LGGTEPTVTDAHLLLGRLPEALLGGEMPLDVAASQAGLSRLADQVGLTPEDCAEGVLEIALWNQANAIRQMTVKRGLDVRDFALVVFGGSGPLQLCRLLDLLDLPVGIVPANPGNLSAFGLLTVDVRNDYVQTLPQRNDYTDLEQISRLYALLEQRAVAGLERESFAVDRRQMLRQADLRYAGQAYEVRVDAPAGPVDAGFRAAVVASFHDTHDATYGYCYRDDPEHRVEWVNLRVSGIGSIAKPHLAKLDPADDAPERALTGRQHVRFGGRWHDAARYDRDGLRAGDEVTGPAVVTEFGSTVPLAPGFSAQVDSLGNLVIRLGSAPADSGRHTS
jgi:N-methylhydantoinase A